MIINSLVMSYSKAIYLYGTRTFSTILIDYVEPVKVYAATGLTNGIHYPVAFNGYTLLQIEEALTEGRITETEYNDTIAYKG